MFSFLIQTALDCILIFILLPSGEVQCICEVQPPLQQSASIQRVVSARPARSRHGSSQVH